jgi:outer membrane biosynthesis protein TonB
MRKKMRFMFISSLMLLFFICFVYSQNVNDQIVKSSKRNVSGRRINVNKLRNPLLDITIRKRDALPQAPADPNPKEPPKGKEPPPKEAQPPKGKEPPPKGAQPPKGQEPPPKGPPPKDPPAKGAGPKQPEPKQPKKPKQPQQPQPPETSPPQPSTTIVTETEDFNPTSVPTVRPYNAGNYADKLKFYQGNSWIIILIITNFSFFTLL